MSPSRSRYCTAVHPETGARCRRKWMHWGQHSATPSLIGAVLRWR